MDMVVDYSLILIYILKKVNIKNDSDDVCNEVVFFLLGKNIQKDNFNFISMDDGMFHFSVDVKNNIDLDY